MDTIEKYLEDQYIICRRTIMYGDYTQDTEVFKEFRWRAEYYRDGLAQYRMLHNPELTYLTPWI